MLKKFELIHKPLIECSIEFCLSWYFILLFCFPLNVFECVCVHSVSSAPITGRTGDKFNAESKELKAEAFFSPFFHPSHPF